MYIHQVYKLYFLNLLNLIYSMIDIQKFLIGTIKDIMERQGYEITFEGEHFLLEAKKDINLPEV